MDGRRRVLLRSLPTLLALLLALGVAPQQPAPPAQAASACHSVTAQSEPAQADPEATATVEPPAERVAVLSTQFTAGLRGCRAPPVASR